MFFPFLFIVYDALIDCHTDTTIAKKMTKEHKFLLSLG